MVSLKQSKYALCKLLIISLLITILHTNIRAQYADTLTVYAADSIEANLPETVEMFGYLAPHIDPFIVYAQMFWASNRFDPKLMRGNNPFQMVDQKGKLRKFDSLDEAVARFILAKADSIKYGSDQKPYLKSYAITASDKNMIQPRMTLGPLEPLSNKVDTGLIFLQVLWATDHFNPKMIKHNNLFQIVDDNGELLRFDSWQDAVADYLVRILDYDKNNESYLNYLERKSNGQWNKKMSDKMRQLYRSLFHKNYDESQFRGYKAQTTENKRTKTSQSRNKL